MEYKLKLHKDVEKQLRRVPKKQQERLVDTMRSLRIQPRPHGCEHILDFLYRVRVGEYRIIYAVFDKEVVVVVCKAERRSDKTYKNLGKLMSKAINELMK